MTSALDDVDYTTVDFNHDIREVRHPMYAAERHYCYNLVHNDFDELEPARDEEGRCIKSPRSLRNLVSYFLVTSSESALRRCNPDFLPSNCYPLLLREAMYQREGHIVAWIVSNWPMTLLRIYQLLPPEDSLTDDYLTRMVDQHNDMALVDYIILGLLKLTQHSNLQVIDFTGFHKDKKLCKELCRLPILWMKPSERNVQNLFDTMSENIELTKDKAQRFLNRISTVYKNMDTEYLHENQTGPLTIHLDLHVTIDDVPIGLTLQSHSPFIFICRRLWMRPIPEVHLPLKNLPALMDTQNLTRLEIQDALLPGDSERFCEVVEALPKFHNLEALSLSNSIDVKTNQQMASLLNKVLRKLRHLQRLDLSYCNISDRLSTILGGLRQSFKYLSLRDCRLQDDDLSFLLMWRPLAGLREANFSCNNLIAHSSTVMGMIERMIQLTCLELAHCQITVPELVQVSRQCLKLRRSSLKVLSIHGYTPLPQTIALDLLACAVKAPVLQKILLFPEAYGFPGDNDSERENNRLMSLKLSYRYLSLMGRPDMELL